MPKIPQLIPMPAFAPVLMPDDFLEDGGGVAVFKGLGVDDKGKIEDCVAAFEGLDVDDEGELEACVAVFEGLDVDDEGRVEDCVAVPAGVNIGNVGKVKLSDCNVVESVEEVDDDGVDVPGNCSGLIAAKVSSVGSSQFVVSLG